MKIVYRCMDKVLATIDKNAIDTTLLLSAGVVEIDGIFYTIVRKILRNPNTKNPHYVVELEKVILK